MRLSLEKTVVEFMQSTQIKNDEKMNICNNLVFISWLIGLAELEYFINSVRRQF